MIPQRFVRVFLDEPVPYELEQFWQTFRSLHPTWTFLTIGSSQLPWMRPHIREVFDQCTTHAGRSDVVRYEYIYQFGGIYVDTDMECLRPWDRLTVTNKLFTGWEDHNMICPTVIGAPPQHPAMGAVLDALPEWFARQPSAPPNQSTGPHLFTHILRERDDVILYDPVYFFPVHWSKKRFLGEPYPEESYGVHHWRASWLADGPPQR